MSLNIGRVLVDPFNVLLNHKNITVPFCTVYKSDWIMSKFQVLRNSRLILACVGLTNSDHPNDPPYKLILSILTYCSLIISFGFGFISVLILVYENIDDLTFVMNEFLLAIAILQLIGIYFSVRFNMDKMETMQRMLQNIIDEGI